MKQRGFTLIELIVVLVILGILAATAAPLFVDLKSDANKAVLQGVESSMRSASSLVYAKALIAGQTGATGSVTVNGTTVNTVFGYPDASLTGITSVVTLSPATDFTVAAGSVSLVKATTAANCKIVYGVATATVAPTFTQTTTGC